MCMTNKTIYHKHINKYLELFNQFSNYMTLYKLDKLDKLPQEANIVIFDDTDEKLSSYSTYLLKRMMESKTPNIIQVRKTGEKDLPWQLSTPINLTA